MSEFKVGDNVEKVTGDYKWPGEVRTVFRTKPKPGHPNGKIRYVVECTVPEVAGALHIYSAKDLKKV